MLKKIALVSCTKQKQDYKCEAKEMYLQSTLFKKITAYIESSEFDDWYILSAKYGLLKKSTIISPYDLTLLRMKAMDRRNWSDNVLQDLISELPVKTNITFFAGEKYRQYLLPQLEREGFICHVPLKGMQIGEQLQFLGKEITRMRGETK